MSKYYYLKFKIRTIKWKNSIDENARFLDGSLLPSVLIENKIDLVEQDVIESDAELRDFSDKNKFSGYFRSSAKLGININESMEFLIKTVIAKLESCNEGRVHQTDSQSIILKNQKSIIQKDKNSCC